MQIDRDDLVKHLKEGIITIVFTKVDGTDRTMNATLQPDKLTFEQKKTNRVMADNPGILRVFDTDISAWRSFRMDSITEVKGFELFWNKFLVEK